MSCSINIEVNGGQLLDNIKLEPNTTPNVNVGDVFYIELKPEKDLKKFIDDNQLKDVSYDDDIITVKLIVKEQRHMLYMNGEIETIIILQSPNNTVSQLLQNI